MSLEGTLVVIVLLIIVGAGALKVVPSYMQNGTIKNILDTIRKDPEMQNATPRAIRDSFSKRAGMNNISVISADDIIIEKDAGGLLLSVSYSVKIPLAGNASLLLEFNTSNSK